MNRTLPLATVSLLALAGATQAQIAPGAAYEFDASLLGTTAPWENSGANGFEAFNGAIIMEVPTGLYAGIPDAVSSLSAPGITAAYNTSAITPDLTGANGNSNAFEGAAGNGSRQSSTFEFWINVTDTSTDQVIADLGGGGRGALFAIDGDTGEFEFFVNGDTNVSVTAPASIGWHQVAGTIFLADDPNPFEVLNGTLNVQDNVANDYVELFIDGALATTSQVGMTGLGTTEIDDWAGGNQAGLGNRGGATYASESQSFGTVNNADAPFQGDIAAYRFYAHVLTEAELLQNWTVALTDVGGGFLEADFNQDSVVDLLDLDILGSNWQTSGATGATGDANGDTVVDLLDLDILGSQWQQSSAAFEAALAASGIPEPSALALLGLGGLTMIRRRRA